MQNIELELDQHSIRFTPDGKIAVIDAIRALSEKNDARPIWRNLSQSRPEIAALCDSYHFRKTVPTPVANSEIWEIIQAWLFEYLVEESLSGCEAFK